MRKEGVAIPKIEEVPIPMVAPVNIQASAAIQVPKASVAIWTPISVLVPVEAIRASESVAIQAPKAVLVFVAKWRVVAIVVEVPVEGHCWLMWVNLKHRPGSRVSTLAAGSRREGSEPWWSKGNVLALTTLPSKGFTSS